MSSPPSSATPLPERLLSVACPTCAATIAVDAGLVGEAAECPLCARGFLVPAAASATPTVRRTASTPRPRTTAPRAEATGVTAPARRPEARPPAAWIVPEAGDAVVSRGGDDEAASLRRTSMARAARRARRNVVMLIAGGSILLGIVMLLGRSRR